MNRDKIWYHKVKTYEGTSPVTKKRSLRRLLRKSVIIMRMSDPLFSETMFPRIATGAEKTFCLFPANLATPGNITINYVSATMFPSLTRP